MKIVSISLYKVEIPMVSSFTTSFGKISKRPTAIVKIKTDEGIVSWGEAAALPFPYYKPETVDTCLLVLKDYISPLVLGWGFRRVEDLMGRLKLVKGNNFAKSGIETSVWMAISIKQNKPLSKVIGGTRNKIGVGESIGIMGSISQTLEEISLRLSQGYQRIKVKIQPKWDIQVVEAIRNKFSSINLMVDANSAYTLGDTEILKKLDSYDLTMLEQPLADDDIIDHAVLQKQIKTPICLDESIHSVDDARRAISIDACRMINIKPGRVGGLLESKRVHDLCQSNNVGVWCGGMLESGIGRAFNIAVASLPNCIYPADMSPNQEYFKDDLVTESFVVDDRGFVNVPQTSGLGFIVDEKKVKKYTTAKINVT